MGVAYYPPTWLFLMAVTLKDSRQFFGICNHLISSRCLHASAVTLRNFVASERRGKKAALGWADVEDICIHTKNKTRERKSKKFSDTRKSKLRERRSASLLKFSDTTKTKVGEGSSTSPQTSSDITERKVRERRSGSLKKSGEREGKAEAKAVPSREASERRRAPEAVVWSASTAETMLLYKDGI